MVRLHMAHFFSAPLVHSMKVNGRSRDVPVRLLNVDKEVDELSNILEVSNMAVNWKTGPATVGNFKQTLCLGCKVVHFSGHGEKGAVVFEDPGSGKVGTMHPHAAVPHGATSGCEAAARKRKSCVR